MHAVEHEDIHDFGAPPNARSLGELITAWIWAFDAGVWRWDRKTDGWTYNHDRLAPEQQLSRLY